MAEEEKVEAENVNKRIGKSVLDHFSQISNDNEIKRIKNASLLLQFLHKSSSDQNFDEVQYALKRIVRGLGGSKNSSRIGFYSTFVALLHTFPFLTIDEVLGCIRKQLQVEGGNSRSEIGDIYIGRVLACGALIRSKKIFGCDKEQWDEVILLLTNAGKSRSYLSMAATKFIAELFTTCEEQHLRKFWFAVSDEVLKPWQHQTLDSLYLLLVILNSFPGFLKAPLLNKTMSCNEILCEENLEAICNVALVSVIQSYLFIVEQGFDIVHSGNFSINGINKT